MVHNQVKKKYNSSIPHRTDQNYKVSQMSVQNRKKKRTQNKNSSFCLQAKTIICQIIPMKETNTKLIPQNRTTKFTPFPNEHGNREIKRITFHFRMQKRTKVNVNQ